ncbi:MAG: ribonuclease PH [Phycisphaerae bacterium]|jgi:ribonuclease PH
MVFRRHDGRRADQLRAVKITPGFVRAADGSCLFEAGGTRVICTASFVEGVPKWRAGSGLGWVTAEYGMLPASTSTRKNRPIGQADSRAVEIQRLIGRVLRNVVRLDRLGENTVYLDCDVLEADGGTRTAAITGAFVALAIATAKAAAAGKCRPRVLSGPVAAVSVGIVEGKPLLDLDYREDSAAQVDMNVAMTAAGQFVEIQGCGERSTFSPRELEAMLRLGRRGIGRLITFQRQAIHRGYRT